MLYHVLCFFCSSFSYSWRHIHVNLNNFGWWIPFFLNHTYAYGRYYELLFESNILHYYIMSSFTLFFFCLNNLLVFNFLIVQKITFYERSKLRKYVLMCYNYNIYVCFEVRRWSYSIFMDILILNFIGSSCFGGIEFLFCFMFKHQFKLMSNIAIGLFIIFLRLPHKGAFLLRLHGVTVSIY